MLSTMGALLTLVLYTISGIFFYSKVMVLVHESDITVMSNLEVGALTYDDKFGASKGLFVAAALTAYDTERESIEEPRYGELVIEHYQWGNGGGLDSGAGILENHPCSDHELGLKSEDDDSGATNFRTFSIYESSRSEVETWKNKFKCVNRDELVIWGDYNSVKAQ